MISVLIKSDKDFGIDVGGAKAAAERVLRKNNLDDVELSISFVDRDFIWDLNKKYRQVDHPTTVLEFPQIGKGPLGQPVPSSLIEFPSLPDRLVRLGDVIICPSEAKEKGFTIEFLLEHGINNLLLEIPAAKNRTIGHPRS